MMKKKEGATKKTKIELKIKRYISVAFVRQPLFQCVFMFQDNLPLLQFL